jgi:hypothetical protein
MFRSAGSSDVQQGAAVQQTLQSLDSAAADTSLASASGLGIPQVRALKREIAEIFPASNLPAFLLQGLLQVQDRHIGDRRALTDLRVLFRETRRIGLYGTFLAAPATIIHGYQRLLTLAGKDVPSAFPDGTWQFYTEFGLREDAARHCVETLGFHGRFRIQDSGFRGAIRAGLSGQGTPAVSLSADAIALSDADAATAWVYAAIHTIAHFDDLLENEWHERAAIRCVELALEDLAATGRLPRKADERARVVAERLLALRAAYRLDRLGAAWTVRRPFSGPPSDPLEGYVAARRRAFDSYLDIRLSDAPPELRMRAQERYKTWRERGLEPFCAQMTIAKSLHSEGFCERREPLASETLCVALQVGGVYHLIDVWERDEQGYFQITPRDGDSARPGQSLPLSRDNEGNLSDRYGQPVVVDRRGKVRIGGMHVGRLRCSPLAVVRAQVTAALREHPPRQAEPDEELRLDTLLALAPRSEQEQLRALLSTHTRAQIAALRHAPVIVNWDEHGGNRSLGQIRRAPRGIGDHGMTIIRTDRSIVFDMSHIFFDGAWGAALAEIMTGFAMASARNLAQTTRRSVPMPQTLTLTDTAAFRKAALAALLPPAEVQAETGALRLEPMNMLRRRLAQRDIDITINDVLVLGRYAHAGSYTLGPAALAGLDSLADQGEEGVRLRERIVSWLATQRTVMPALLIPMDASAVDPRARLHPATLRNPAPNLLPRLERCDALLREISKRPASQSVFEAERVELVRDLITFGATLRALREITTRGEGFLTAALKLFAHLPRPMQGLLDQIPQKIDVLNEIVKGVEVFSNIGQVTNSSSVSRFASSRDDGDTKLLIWGIMTDAQGNLVITLRDFRPFIADLLATGHPALAELLAADFLAAYADGTNRLVKQLQRVLAAK